MKSKRIRSTLLLLVIWGAAAIAVDVAVTAIDVLFRLPAMGALIGIEALCQMMVWLAVLYAIAAIWFPKLAIRRGSTRNSN